VFEGCFAYLRNFSHKKLKCLTSTQKQKAVYFRIINTQFKIVSHKISQIGKTTFSLKKRILKGKIRHKMQFVNVTQHRNKTKAILVLRNSAQQTTRINVVSYLPKTLQASSWFSKDVTL